MKRKILFAAIALILLLAFCFVGCESSDEMLGKVNNALSAEYSAVTVNVTAVKDDIELNGVYNVTFEGENATVDYSFDRLNELDVNGGNPDSYITKVTGTVHVVDGKIVENESAQDLTMGELDFTGFSFKAGFLKDVKATKSTLSATVSNPQGFLGNSEFACSDMKTEVVLFGDALSKLSLAYVSENGAQITVEYLFTV